MAENLEIIVEVDTKTSKAKLKDFESQTKKVGEQTKKSASVMSSSWTKIGAGVVAATYAVKKMSDAYAIQLKAETQLNTAVRLNSKAGEQATSQWLEYASALQAITTFGDEATLSQIAYLKTLGLTDEQTKKVIEASMDLSSATGMELESAVKNMAKTLSGMQGELGEAIPALKELTVEELKAGEGIDLVAKAVKGQASAWAETGQGGLEQAGNSFGDAVEKGGQFFTLLADRVGIIRATISLFDGVNESLVKVINSFTSWRDLETETELVNKIKEYKEELKEVPSLFKAEAIERGETRKIQQKILLAEKKLADVRKDKDVLEAEKTKVELLQQQKIATEELATAKETQKEIDEQFEKDWTAFLNEEEIKRQQSVEAAEQAKQDAKKKTAENERIMMQQSMNIAQSALQLGATISSAMEVNNKKDFESKKAMNIGLAIGNTALAITKAISSLPPPYGAIQAGIYGTMGAVQVSTIANTQYKELGGSVVAGRPYIVGEKGQEMFVPQTSGEIIPNNNLNGGGSTVNFSMVVNTNIADKRSMEEFYSENAYLITKNIQKGLSV